MPANVSTVAELVTVPSQELARRCRISPLEITRLVRDVCQYQASLSLTFQTLESLDDNEEGAFSIGDAILDEAIGGGLRPGMIWEIVGERYQFSVRP
jgi:DNA repair protein RAD57